MSITNIGMDIYFFLLLLILFFAFFVSPFFSAFASTDPRRKSEPLGITGVFARVVRQRKEALLVWGILAFADSLLATAFLYLIPTLSLPIAFLGIGCLLFVYVVEIHGINVIFGKEVVKNGN
ncbi:MAG: hypothetical protein QW620_03575 [Thermoplasmata archaeon]